MNWTKSKSRTEFPLQSTYRCSKKETVILASITADDINPLCLMTIVSRSQAAYKMRLEQPQVMFSFYQSSWPKLRKYANESFDIKQFLLSLATFFILKGCTPLLDDVTTENHAHLQAHMSHGVKMRYIQWLERANNALKLFMVVKLTRFVFLFVQFSNFTPMELLSTEMFFQLVHWMNSSLRIIVDLGWWRLDKHSQFRKVKIPAGALQ